MKPGHLYPSSDRAQPVISHSIITTCSQYGLIGILAIIFVAIILVTFLSFCLPVTESWCIFIISCSFVVHTVHLKGCHRLFCYINDSCSSVLSWTLLAHWHQLTAHESDVGVCVDLWNPSKKKKGRRTTVCDRAQISHESLHYKTGNMFIDPRFAFESSLTTETELSYLYEPEKMETWCVWGSRNCGWYIA